MKSMFIIDTPKECLRCLLFQTVVKDDKTGLIEYCAIGDRFNPEHMIIKNVFKIQDWCPLKPLVKKKMPSGSDIYNDYVMGWNECVEEIEK